MNLSPSLSRLGQVMQLAFVPKDIDAALRYWTQTMGVGPFYHLDHLTLEKAHYRGEPASIDFSVWIAYWGDLQIELIQQHNDAPSIYSTWSAQGREGLHHVCLVVQDMAEARRQCAAAGAQVMQEVWLVGGGEAIYVEAGDGLIELVELSEPVRQVFDTMKATARHWNGQDPVRPFG